MPGNKAAFRAVVSPGEGRTAHTALSLSLPHLLQSNDTEVRAGLLSGLPCPFPCHCGWGPVTGSRNARKYGAKYFPLFPVLTLLIFPLWSMLSDSELRGPLGIREGRSFIASTASETNFVRLIVIWL